MRRKVGLTVVVWIALWFVTWGALLADLQGRFDNAPFNERWCRRDLAFSVGIAVLPPAWLITLAVTGFYEHGFRWRCPTSGASAP